ncbi:hypothetical protein BDR26DRAFT_318605 [Obelidium mucronatum]|nr:hypothetical protein BDR26DRAFT_318605 [Obelidium mucronatum]
MTDLSVHHLEFSLSHNPVSLLAKSDSANLTKRDANLVRLVICSGLYPHIAIADDANAYRPASEQIYHTKTKRFVKMLPTSVFCVKPELLHPKEVIAPSNTSNTTEKETLDSIRPKQELTELLCYLELLETNKPYLTNVLRVPAVPVCLLFAHRLDVNHDMTHVLVDSWLHLHFKNPSKGERVLVLANWLRTAWEHVMGRRLKKVDGLAAGRDSQDGAVDDEDGEQESEAEEEIELMGTAVKLTATEEADKNGSELKPKENDENMVKKRIPSDWSDFSFLPTSVKRIRYDWEMGTTRCADADVMPGEDFEVLTEYDLSKRLGEFVDIDFQCTVERLRMQDVPSWFGYDPFKTDGADSVISYSQLPSSTSSDSHLSSSKVFKGEVLVTPNFHYFVSNPSSLKNLSLKKKSKLRCVGPQVILVERTVAEDGEDGQRLGPQFDTDPVEAIPLSTESNIEKEARVTGDMVMGCAPAGVADGARKPFACRVCGQVMELTVIETLKHKRSCK